MALDRKDAIIKITSLSEPIVDHLYKMFVVNSPQSHHHWRSELNAWLKKINSFHLKPSAKKPTKDDLYDWITKKQSLLTTRYLQKQISIWKDEYKIYDNIDYEFVVEKVSSILNLICKDISDDELDNISEYISK
jgi:hypothetical protein